MVGPVLLLLILPSQILGDHGHDFGPAHWFRYGIDLNHDGLLNARELCSAITEELRNLRTQPVTDETCKDFEEKFDKDGNNKIDPQELNSLYLKFHQLLTMFIRGDFDGFGLMKFGYFVEVALPRLGLSLNQINQMILITCKSGHGFTNLSLDKFMQLVLNV
eukprot:TRINITY_DN17242_c0_g1_i1.p1 TRINITY_DN17242_c0_g1~~TRINITY_DN17242_c0_g1_i1.p1  ORF type:complete len:162 (-),score=37.30 TRINITY_DN17242_c0_g1_i1:40-525(-)